MTVVTSLALSRFKQLPQRTNEVWQGALLPMPMWVDNPADPLAPLRPTGAVWRSLRSGRLHIALLDEHAAGPAVALDALMEFARRESKVGGSRPSRVEVRDAGLRDALADALSGTGTTVVLVPDVPAVHDAVRELAAMQGDVAPGYLEGKGVTVERLHAFAAAAVAFHRTQIWRHLANDDLIVVEAPVPPKAMSHLCVMGNGGEQFGLAFFPTRSAFDKLISGDPRRTQRAYGLTFDAPDGVPFSDLDLWAAHGLPLAAPRAYPFFAELSRRGPVRRPDARALTLAEALLRALADTTEADLDTGRWLRHVTTFDGPVTVTLNLPDVLADTRRRGTEAARTSGLFDAIDAAATGSNRALTPLEQAQELADQAHDATGRRRIGLARAALALSDDCADAWSLLAEAAPTLEEAAPLYAKAVDAGRRALGEPGFEALAGRFWGDLSTRPYMRARAALAHTLASLERVDDAVAHYESLLTLNPDDNQGNRYSLLAVLLECNRNDAARALVDRYRDDAGTAWAYGRALLAFRAEGDTPAAGDALRDAIDTNPHVARFLVAPEEIPAFDSPYVTFGGPDEAVGVFDAFAPAFEQTPGALEWVERHAASRSARSVHGRRRRREPRR
jgi:tetratricopeptide (TPR) repeat protein